MSRITDRTSTKAAGHIKAQRATSGAKAKARKAMGKSFRRPPLVEVIPVTLIPEEIPFNGE